MIATIIYTVLKYVQRDNNHVLDHVFGHIHQDKFIMAYIHSYLIFTNVCCGLFRGLKENYANN